MSTKIFNGIRFVPKDIAGVQKVLFGLQDQAEKIIYDVILSICSGMICRALDFGTDEVAKTFEVEKIKEDGILSIWARRQLVDLLHKAEESKEKNSIDFSCRVTVFPLRDQVLGIYFCECRELSAMFLNNPKIEDFHYQNCTDRPEDVSAKDWRQRERLWDKALCRGGLGVPALSGFTMDISPVHWCGTPYMFDVKELVRAQAPFAERVKNIARECVQAEWEKGKDLSDRKAWFDWLDYRRSPEFAESVKKTSKSVRAGLKRRYSIKDFERKGPCYSKKFLL